MPRINYLNPVYLDITAGDRICIRKPGSTVERYVWAYDDARGCFTADSTDVSGNREGIHLTGSCSVPELVGKDEWWDLVEVEKAFPHETYA